MGPCKCNGEMVPQVILRGSLKLHSFFLMEILKGSQQCSEATFTCELSVLARDYFPHRG